MGALASLGGDPDISCQRMAAALSPTGHEHHPERNESHIPRKVSENGESVLGYDKLIGGSMLPFWAHSLGLTKNVMSIEGMA